jgi:hypothetical protein
MVIIVMLDRQLANYVITDVLSVRLTISQVQYALNAEVIEIRMPYVHVRPDFTKEPSRILIVVNAIAHV